MNFSEIDLGQTHIRLTTDLANHELERHILSIRRDLENYILKNEDFLLSLGPIETNEDLPLIVRKMVE